MSQDPIFRAMSISRYDLRNANWEEYSLDDYLAVVHTRSKNKRVPESF